MRKSEEPRPLTLFDVVRLVIVRVTFVTVVSRGSGVPVVEDYSEDGNSILPEPTTGGNKRFAGGLPRAHDENDAIHHGTDDSSVRKMKHRRGVDEDYVELRASQAE